MAIFRFCAALDWLLLCSFIHRHPLVLRKPSCFHSMSPFHCPLSLPSPLPWAVAPKFTFQSDAVPPAVVQPQPHYMSEGVTGESFPSPATLAGCMLSFFLFLFLHDQIQPLFHLYILASSSSLIPGRINEEWELKVRVHNERYNGNMVALCFNAIDVIANTQFSFSQWHWQHWLAAISSVEFINHSRSPLLHYNAPSKQKL